MLMKKLLVSQVHSSQSCGFEFSCQVRNLFLFAAATSFQNNTTIKKEFRQNNCQRFSSYCQSHKKSAFNTYRLKHCLFSGSQLFQQRRQLQQQQQQSSVENCRHYSRFSANTILTGTDTMKLTDYDCIGFDLDNTLLRYKLTEMVELEYKVYFLYMLYSYIYKLTEMILGAVTFSRHGKRLCGSSTGASNDRKHGLFAQRLNHRFCTWQHFKNRLRWLHNESVPRHHPIERRSNCLRLWCTAYVAGNEWFCERFNGCLGWTFGCRDANAARLL